MCQFSLLIVLVFHNVSTIAEPSEDYILTWYFSDEIYHISVIEPVGSLVFLCILCTLPVVGTTSQASSSIVTVLPHVFKSDTLFVNVLNWLCM